MAINCHNTPGLPGETLSEHGQADGAAGMIRQPQFKFREVLFNTPHDNLCTAICLIQSHILASESLLNPESMFGLHRFDRADLEAAVAMLVPPTGYLEATQWEGEAKA